MLPIDILRIPDSELAEIFDKSELWEEFSELEEASTSQIDTPETQPVEHTDNPYFTTPTNEADFFSMVASTFNSQATSASYPHIQPITNLPTINKRKVPEGTSFVNIPKGWTISLTKSDDGSLYYSQRPNSPNTPSHTQAKATQKKPATMHVINANQNSNLSQS
jgi:hypothetical protein